MFIHSSRPLLRSFQDLAESTFDLLILGGGIYGTWVARDAASRGLKVALIEKGDWASGTSSASSKLIHGGLRYLENYEFGLVRKTLKERKLLADLAPHRSWPLDFLLPIYRGGRLKRWPLKAGLLLYDLLAGRGQPVASHAYWSKKRILKQSPFLRSEALLGGFRYGDCGTDDARFCLEIVAGAIQAGAVAVSYVEGLSLLRGRGNGVVEGALVQDQISGQKAEVRARQILLTTGAYAEAFLQRQLPGGAVPTKARTRFTKGIHLVMPALGGEEAHLLTAPKDGRVFFFIPWYGRTLVGTTDTAWSGDPDHLQVQEEDVDYLLKAANSFLEDQPWGRSDVLGSFAGLRTLQNQEGLAPSEISREWTLQQIEPGLWLPIGGKFTSARVEAAEMVDAIANAEGRAVGNSQTHRQAFPWTPEDGFEPWQAAQQKIGRGLGLDSIVIENCVRRYGKRVDGIWKLIQRRPALGARFHPDLPFVKAEFLYCAKEEMVVNLVDLIRRRIPVSILAPLEESFLREAADLAGEALGWDSSQRIHQMKLAESGPEYWRSGA
ncbi:MAG: glycerol-3-phosphate dehydrogenase/oxidase [Planctomycetota bacterium]|nr:MAG: glycerol-3-phosphate dehydrogenase/oxidase [Planctomycetota bacterium]